LAEIWQEVLGIKKIGINDNFFELGGHSLKAVQVISRIKQKLNVNLLLSDLFQYSKLCFLADFIESKLISKKLMIKINNFKKRIAASRK
jgi:acyl carrier protein